MIRKSKMEKGMNEKKGNRNEKKEKKMSQKKGKKIQTDRKINT